jgi:hypothetical protein
MRDRSTIGALCVAVVTQMLVPGASVRHTPARDMLAATESLLGFRFERGRCEIAPLNCLRRQPREWTADEIDEVLALTRYGDAITRVPAGNRGEQWRTSRSFALQMRPIRIPSMQSLHRPVEAFSDIGSHLILDRRARRYLPAPVVAYFDQRVLSRDDSRLTRGRCSDKARSRGRDAHLPGNV